MKRRSLRAWALIFAAVSAGCDGEVKPSPPIFAATKTGNAGNFWSMRQTPRSCGHISVTEHFKAWAAQGLKLGKMYEAKVLVEAGGGVGRIDSRPPTSCGNEAR